ncbi:hypothetical protein [Rhodohalobacter sp.]|uniref:hypothetical protein n=1 Tax=Rhodohalobacter sp. TaxID=1974210 RepID=UPI002ACEEA79|nr:hypothetical protein [Rhodohalobacter sp.]MDZ7754843.1 hypothetical protein [Rhodohalobacter sp.]
MITKEKIKEYFEQEIENQGKLMELLYRDKKLLNEERFGDFATELLQRAKKAYLGSMAFGMMFFMLGSMYLINLYLFNTSSFGSFDVHLGYAYILLSFTGAIFSTKEYYGIRGSMTLLLNLLEADKEAEPDITPELETA